MRRKAELDPQDDLYKVIPTMTAMADTMSSKDVAHAAYVFEYIASQDPDRRVQALANALAETYAKRFASWLGHVFLARANRVHRSKEMSELTDGLGTWVSNIPGILTEGKPALISSYIPQESRILDFKVLEVIGSKILKVVWADWQKVQEGMARTASIEDLPVRWSKDRDRYEISGGASYNYRNELKNLGFWWDPNFKVWHNKKLSPRALQILPQAATAKAPAAAPPPPPPPAAPEPPAAAPEPMPKLVKVPGKRGPRAKPPVLNSEIEIWYFKDWLPANIRRFTTVFNSYGKSEDAPASFTFTLAGNKVAVGFTRDINTVDEAVAVLKARYGKQKIREGWMEALDMYYTLQRVTGKAAIHAVDMANNLEHSHGAMMEHFPTNVQSWYPRFLDFKYTAHPMQMIGGIGDGELRMLAKELLPLAMRQNRVLTPKLDHRTPKGLALEISSQRGLAQKRKTLLEVKRQHPEMYADVVLNLIEKGMEKTIPAEDLPTAKVAYRYLKAHG